MWWVTISLIFLSTDRLQSSPAGQTIYHHSASFDNNDFGTANRKNLLHSKHILNAQVSIRAPCCKLWFDCPECHAESQSHKLAKTTEMAFLCKKCKKAFRKDMAAYEESDEYCPHCDNHYVGQKFLTSLLACSEIWVGHRCEDPSGCCWCAGRGCSGRCSVCFL